MSDTPVFGDKSSAARVARGKRARFAEPLEVIALKAQGAARLQAQDDAAIAAWAGRVEAGNAWQKAGPVAAPVAVTRKRRVRRARINTIAPSKANCDLRVIYHGLDAFVLNVVGSVRWDFITLMPMAQEEAKELDGLALAPLPPFLGEGLMMRAYGGGTFKFLMGNGDVTVKVRKADHSANMAAAQVEVTAACLHRLGGVEAVRAVRDWCRSWAGHSVLQVSEIDLAVDVQGWHPTFADFYGQKAFVCPVSRPALIPYDEDHIGYVRFGTGGASGSRSGQAPIQVTMYDKTEEIRVHDKGWFVPLWSRSPLYVPDERVTRVECRYRREWLKERRLDTIEQVLAKLNSIWCEGLEWCRYCVPVPARYNDAGEEMDPHRSTWEVREEWCLLRGVSWAHDAREPLERIDQVRPRLERTLAALGGYMVTVQALMGPILEIDIDAISVLAVGAIKKRWEGRGETYDVKVLERYKKLSGMMAI
jgi:hypothetical protein